MDTVPGHPGQGKEIHHSGECRGKNAIEGQNGDLIHSVVFHHELVIGDNAREQGRMASCVEKTGEML